MGQGWLTSFGSVVPGGKAGIIIGLVDMNPGSSRDAPGIHAGAERECGFKEQRAVLRPGYFSGEAHRRAKARILADDDGNFIAPFISGPHQVQGQADIDALLLAVSADPTAINVYVVIRQGADLVRPEVVPEVPLGTVRIGFGRQ